MLATNLFAKPKLNVLINQQAPGHHGAAEVNNILRLQTSVTTVIKKKAFHQSLRAERNLKKKRGGIAMMIMMIIDIMTMERDRESTKKVLKMIIITGGRIIVGHVAIVVKKSFTIPVGIAVIPETAIMTTIKGRRITDIKTSGLTKSRGHVTNMSGLNLMTVITSTPNTMSDIKIIEAPSMMQNIENQEDLASTIIANNSNP